jgi:hypothetical protein
MSNILQQLKFGPWHGGGGDPVGPWVFEHMNKNQLVSMAKVELEYNQAVLEAQLKANTQRLAIIAGAERAE